MIVAVVAVEAIDVRIAAVDNANPEMYKKAILILILYIFPFCIL
jgi:hypothetical protein